MMLSILTWRYGSDFLEKSKRNDAITSGKDYFVSCILKIACIFPCSMQRTY